MCSMPAATVLHADLDAFYASVEQRDAPELRGCPVIVGGGVVLSASYEARAAGVRTAMGGARARGLCPEAVVVRPRMSVYAAASRQVFGIFDRYSPVVEALSIDEAFLDVRGLEHILGIPIEIAMRLREEVRADVGLPITVGIARTKFLAKVASAAAKPDGLLLVPPEAELEFLHPLPVERVWGVGAVTARKLHERGIRTVAELAQVDESSLARMLGPAAARQLSALAWARDPRRVQPRRRRRSIGAQHALGRGSPDRDELVRTLAVLVDRVARRLRRARRACRTVVLRLRFADYSRATRSQTLPVPTTRTARILTAARELLDAAEPIIARRGITLVGVALTNLRDEPTPQLALPFDRAGELDAALDGIRDRFGSDAIRRAASVGRPAMVTVPLLAND
jgi:DNA polymerase-4